VKDKNEQEGDFGSFSALGAGPRTQSRERTVISFCSFLLCRHRYRQKKQQEVSGKRQIASDFVHNCNFNLIE